jgi:hypothetical protein
MDFRKAGALRKGHRKLALANLFIRDYRFLAIQNPLLHHPKPKESEDQVPDDF